MAVFMQQIDIYRFAIKPLGIEHPFKRPRWRKSAPEGKNDAGPCRKCPPHQYRLYFINTPFWKKREVLSSPDDMHFLMTLWRIAFSYPLLACALATKGWQWRVCPQPSGDAFKDCTCQQYPKEIYRLIKYKSFCWPALEGKIVAGQLTAKIRCSWMSFPKICFFCTEDKAFTVKLSLPQKEL